MSTQRHLSRAPIREALIDIQFNPVPELDMQAIATKYASDNAGVVVDLYPSLFEFRDARNMEAEHTPSAAGVLGKRIDIPHRHQVIQFRNSSFTFSRLAPYDTWEEMASAAEQAWIFFVAHAGVEQINRISLRYINVLRLPSSRIRFDHYLTAPPVIPPQLTQGVSGFLSRVIYPSKKDVVMVTQSLDGELQESSELKVVLDIDVSHQCQLNRSDFDELGRILLRLRGSKNEAFFAFLTEAALEMFK